MTTFSMEDLYALLDTIRSGNLAVAVNLGEVGLEYETVAASQTGQVLGATGAVGDYLSHVLIVPASVSPGAVTLLDGATSIPIFAGGTNSLTELYPMVASLGIRSASGAWSITTGANVSVIAAGDFT